jgi:hypothetical protein
VLTCGSCDAAWAIAPEFMPRQRLDRRATRRMEVEYLVTIARAG